jgi:hypothetical protein
MAIHRKPHPRNSWHLYYDKARAPLANVVGDGDHPDMWRIAWPSGLRSDIVNLSRTKGAAVAIAERGPPARNRRLLHWKKEPSRTTTEAPLAEAAE